MVVFYRKYKVSSRPSSTPCVTAASPPRPSFLPISEPIPVPTQRDSYQRMQIHDNSTTSSASPVKVSDLVIDLTNNSTSIISNEIVDKVKNYQDLKSIFLICILNAQLNSMNPCISFKLPKKL